MKIQSQIEEKIKEALIPRKLDIVNESYLHATPAGSESHFKLLIVSDRFEGKDSVTRYRMVHEILKDEIKHHVHALSLTLKTPLEWEKKNLVSDSPLCVGGSKNDKR